MILQSRPDRGGSRANFSGGTTRAAAAGFTLSGVRTGDGPAHAIDGELTGNPWSAVVDDKSGSRFDHVRIPTGFPRETEPDWESEGDGDCFGRQVGSLLSRRKGDQAQ